MNSKIFFAFLASFKILNASRLLEVSDKSLVKCQKEIGEYLNKPIDGEAQDVVKVINNMDSESIRKCLEVSVNHKNALFSKDSILYQKLCNNKYKETISCNLESDSKLLIALAALAEKIPLEHRAKEIIFIGKCQKEVNDYKLMEDKDLKQISDKTKTKDQEADEVVDLLKKSNANAQSISVCLKPVANAKKYQLLHDKIGKASELASVSKLLKDLAK